MKNEGLPKVPHSSERVQSYEYFSIYTKCFLFFITYLLYNRSYQKGVIQVSPSHQTRTHLT